MNRTKWKSTLLAAGLLSSMAVALPVIASPIESAIDMTGIIGTTSIAYGDHTVNATLSTAIETDSYTFTAQTGDQIRFLVRGLSSGLDPSLVLRSPLGTVIDSTSCIVSSGLCSAILDHGFTDAGLYTINLSDRGLNQGGSYQIHLEQYPPVNNWVGFQYATPVSETLGNALDLDFFAFNGVEGTTANLALRSFTSGLDPALQVWDPFGALIVDISCVVSSGLCTAAQEISFLTTGTYKVGISDVALNQGGNYQLQVSCAFGNCPLPSALAPVPMAPVPEPATYAMLLAGLGAVGMMAKRRRQTTR